MSHDPVHYSIVEATPATLASNVANFDAGDECLVTSLEASFTFSPASAAIVDNVNVINGPGGVGRWLRTTPRPLTDVTGAGIGPGLEISLADKDALVYADTVVASALILLPPATTVQREITVVNNGGGAHIAKVGAAGTDAMNGGTYVELAAWESATFVVIAEGQWVLTGGRGTYVVA